MVEYIVVIVKNEGLLVDESQIDYGGGLMALMVA